MWKKKHILVKEKIWEIKLTLAKRDMLLIFNVIFYHIYFLKTFMHLSQQFYNFCIQIFWNRSVHFFEICICQLFVLFLHAVKWKTSWGEGVNNMTLMNLFWEMVDQRKALSLISSGKQCLKYSPLQVSENLWAGFQPGKSLS